MSNLSYSLAAESLGHSVRIDSKKIRRFKPLHQVQELEKALHLGLKGALDSAQITFQDREQCLVTRAHEYLTKPVSLKKLTGIMNHLLAG